MQLLDSIRVPVPPTQKGWHFSANWHCSNSVHEQTGKCTLLRLSAYTEIYSKWRNVTNSKSINFNVKMKTMTAPEENRKIFSYSCGRQRFLKGDVHAKNKQMKNKTNKKKPPQLQRKILISWILLKLRTSIIKNNETGWQVADRKNIFSPSLWQTACPDYIKKSYRSIQKTIEFSNGGNWPGTTALVSTERQIKTLVI